MEHYMDWASDEAYRAGKDDYKRYHENSFDYDRYSYDELDKAYYEGQADAARERREEDERREREEQREQDRRNQQRWAHERNIEEPVWGCEDPYGYYLDQQQDMEGPEIEDDKYYEQQYEQQLEMEIEKDKEMTDTFITEILSNKYINLSYRKSYIRNEDMSSDGYLSLMIEDDNDIIITLWGEDVLGDYRSVSVQFCTNAGGGKSPNTLKALKDLILAIEKDNNDDNKKLY